MKTAAFLLKFLFTLLLLTTLTLLVAEVAQVQRPAPLPARVQPGTTAPSVYSYVQPASR